MTSTLYICQTCRMGAAVPDDGIVPGERLLQAVQSQPLPDGLRILPVACLSACGRGCAIALSRDGAWTYVQGGLSPEDGDEVLTMARQYAESVDGIVPWRERSALFRKNTLARIPPLPQISPNSPPKDQP